MKKKGKKKEKEKGKERKVPSWVKSLEKRYNVHVIAVLKASLYKECDHSSINRDKGKNEYNITCQQCSGIFRVKKNVNFEI